MPVLFTLVGGASAATSLITASPGTVTADGSSTTTLTVTVKDAEGNAVAGTAVMLTGSGTDNTFDTISGTTNAQGLFTAMLTLSTKAQTETITATEGSVQETTAVTFVADASHLSESLSSITASPGSVAADGSSTTTLTVTLEDVSNGTPGSECRR